MEVVLKLCCQRAFEIPKLLDSALFMDAMGHTAFTSLTRRLELMRAFTGKISSFASLQAKDEFIEERCTISTQEYGDRIARSLGRWVGVPLCLKRVFPLWGL